MNQTGLLWEVKGDRMIYRFQTSNAGRQMRQQFLLSKTTRGEQPITPEVMVPVISMQD